MVFNSLQFLWFFLIVYGVYRILPAVLPAHRAHRSQNWLLLIASYYFYAAWDYRFVTLLAASTIVDYTCGRVLGRMTDRRRRRAVMWVSIGFNLAMLGFFKYFNFFAANLQALFGALGWQVDFVTLRVLLPIGISFYTFVRLIAWGFFQKIVVADNLAPLASHVFAPEAHPTGINVLLGTYAFAFQIYGDFAGYSNIARGTSKLMGIELIENFRFPYLVVTPQAFWRNWHISLSTWLRDYLYIPLGGSRGTPAQTRRNLLITMILGGLWHGAAWTFVLWGLYQGVLLVLYRPFEPVFAAMTPARRLLAWLLMFHLTCYGWLIFRAPSPGKIGELTRSLLTHFSPSTMDVTALVIPLLLYTVPLLIVHLYEAARDNLLAVPQAMTIVRYSVYAATVYLIFLFGNFGGSDFIYFQF